MLLNYFCEIYFDIYHFVNLFCHTINCYTKNNVKRTIFFPPYCQQLAHPSLGPSVGEQTSFCSCFKSTRITFTHPIYNLYLIYKRQDVMKFMWSHRWNHVDVTEKESVGPQDRKEQNLKKMLIKRTLILYVLGRGKNMILHHLLLWWTFGQDITFCCLEVYISVSELIWRLKIQQQLLISER